MRDFERLVNKNLDLLNSLDNHIALGEIDKCYDLLAKESVDLLAFLNYCGDIKYIETGLQEVLVKLDGDKIVDNMATSEDKEKMRLYIKTIKKEHSTIEKIKQDLVEFLDTITGENEYSRTKTKEGIKAFFDKFLKNDKK